MQVQGWGATAFTVSTLPPPASASADQDTSSEDGAEDFDADTLTPSAVTECNSIGAGLQARIPTPSYATPDTTFIGFVPEDTQTV